MARITQAMLENALGGPAVLRQLLDRDQDGVADSSLVSQILDEADGEADSYITLAILGTDAVVTTSKILLLKELDCAVYLCWMRGTMAQAMPPEVRAAREDAIRWYQDVRDRRASLGTSTRPTAAQPVEQVLKLDTEDYFRAGGPRRRFDGWS